MLGTIRILYHLELRAQLHTRKAATKPEPRPKPKPKPTALIFINISPSTIIPVAPGRVISKTKSRHPIAGNKSGMGVELKVKIKT